MRRTRILLAAGVALILTACGPGEPTDVETPAAAPAAPAAADGQRIYNRSCAVCHAAGVAGAPKPGDKDDWVPRIAQGMDVLYTHSIDGYTGSKGYMPPRGGAAGLSDEEVKAAVDFMVAQSR